MVMRTTLSKKEFAQALGMKADDLFVQKMFNVVDKDGDERISFQVRFFSLATTIFPSFIWKIKASYCLLE